MTMNIGLIGAGAMGGAIGERFLATGNRLTVFDLDTAKVDALVSKGASSAPSAAEVGVECE
ncbi:MAG: NAD(P)-binding domain-containing protein, partial [Pseudomonadota bacterium]